MKSALIATLLALLALAGNGCSQTPRSATEAPANNSKTEPASATNSAGSKNSAENIAKNDANPEREQPTSADLAALPEAVPADIPPAAITDLLAARLLGQAAPSCKAIDSTAAYAIQGTILQRLLNPTNPPIGYKIAATTPSAQRDLQVTEPISGLLTTSMLQRADANIPAPTFPTLVEVEVALVIGRDIRVSEEKPETAATVSDAISGVCLAIELPTWRYNVAPNGLDLIADNAGANRVVVGPIIERDSLPAGLFQDILTGNVNASLEIVSDAAPLNVRGPSSTNPSEMLAWLSNHLHQRQSFVPAGAIILTGATLTPQPLPTNFSRISASVIGLDTLTIEQ